MPNLRNLWILMPKTNHVKVRVLVIFVYVFVEFLFCFVNFMSFHFFPFCCSSVFMWFIFVLCIVLLNVVFTCIQVLFWTKYVGSVNILSALVFVCLNHSHMQKENVPRTYFQETHSLNLSNKIHQNHTKVTYIWNLCTHNHSFVTLLPRKALTS